MRLNAYFKRAGGNLQKFRYITENDVLDSLQWIIGAQALGIRTILEDEEWTPSVAAHLMPQVFYGLMYKHYYI
jgi:hypothetical protein